MADPENRTDREVDDFTGVETTGHSWDGIKELNNPMPRWWLWTFYATILWGLVYTILYPAWPLVNRATEGVLGWSSRGDVANEIQKAELANADRIEAIRNASLDEIVASDELRQFSVSAGSAAFKVNCVQCHGSGAAGSPGYPNLNDDAWIWGGTLDDIYLTLQHGIRHPGDDDTRISDMPAYGADELLTREEISDVAWYIRQLSDQEADQAAASRGAVIYEENCAACHGDNGEGVRELGGPNLADSLWLYGGEYEEIVAQVSNPRMGVMPGWEDRLGEVTTKQLAVYVHSLGGGE